MLDRIKEIIGPVLEEEGVELVDIVFRREAGNKYVLRLLVDTEGGVMLADCVRLNEKISQVLDEANVISESYMIEVDSPGVDRWFTSRRDYERSTDKIVRVTLNERILDKKEYIGRLKEISDNSIKIDVEKKGLIEVPFEKIVRARQEVEFRNRIS